MVGKSAADPNFVAAWQGCADEAQKSGDTCLNLSPAGNSAQARQQDAALHAALARPLAGLAVSVTHARLLAGSSLAAAAQKKLPVVTFDSDLDENNRALRRAYIGPDNIEFGARMASFVMGTHPRGGTACLLSGDANDSNLNQRLLGVRRQLSGNPNLAAGSRLRGERGWIEPDRCPFHSGDNRQRAVKQLVLALDDQRVDVVISMGQFPVLDPALFRSAVEPLRERLQHNTQDIVVATGELTPEQRALLRDGLVRAYASIDFTEMGRATYRSMKQLAEGQDVPAVTRTGFLIQQR